MTDIILVYSTFPDADTARKVAKSLLENKLVACCNILPGMESHYIWQGKMETANEVVMLCKTMQDTAAQTMDHITKLHPYDTAAILQLPVTNANTDFLKWVQDSVRD